MLGLKLNHVSKSGHRCSFIRIMVCRLFCASRCVDRYCFQCISPFTEKYDSIHINNPLEQLTWTSHIKTRTDKYSCTITTMLQRHFFTFRIIWLQNMLKVYCRKLFRIKDFVAELHIRFLDILFQFDLPKERPPEHRRETYQLDNVTKYLCCQEATFSADLSLHTARTGHGECGRVLWWALRRSHRQIRNWEQCFNRK